MLLWREINARESDLPFDQRFKVCLMIHTIISFPPVLLDSSRLLCSAEKQRQKSSIWLQFGHCASMSGSDLETSKGLQQQPLTL